MKPRPASQRAMMQKPSQKQLRAAFDAQQPTDMPVREIDRPKRRKIDGHDKIDDVGEK